MKITFYGHASLGIAGGKYHLVDPYISANQKRHIDLETLKADYILLTHAHGDHILDVEANCKRTNAVIVSNAEIAGYYAAKGFQSHPMNHTGVEF
jgi:L-ascorbate metabolism protein UlaG (beta-lactamase superfamily)